MGDVRLRDCCFCGTLELENAVYRGRKSKRVLFMGDVRVRECCLWEK